MFYAGDELYPDEITSGQFDDERDAIEAEYDGAAEGERLKDWDFDR